MQPYFLPYIGYFQLISAVDVFVIYDDVNYIKKGWLNRNNFIIQKIPKLLSIPVKKASQNKLINEILLLKEKEYQKILKTIEINYLKSTNYNEHFDNFKSIVFENKTNNLLEFNVNLIKWALKGLNIKTKFILSSDIPKNSNLKAQEKIIDICQTLNAKTYINLPGGKMLYDKKTFSDNKINLEFLESSSVEYKHYGINKFYQNLSFFDIKMNVESNILKTMLTDYKLT